MENFFEQLLGGIFLFFALRVMPWIVGLTFIIKCLDVFLVWRDAKKLKSAEKTNEPTPNNKPGVTTGFLYLVCIIWVVTYAGKTTEYNTENQAKESYAEELLATKHATKAALPTRILVHYSVPDCFYWCTELLLEKRLQSIVIRRPTARYEELTLSSNAKDCEKEVLIKLIGACIAKRYIDAPDESLMYLSTEMGKFERAYSYILYDSQDVNNRSEIARFPYFLYTLVDLPISTEECNSTFDCIDTTTKSIGDKDIFPLLNAVFEDPIDGRVSLDWERFLPGAEPYLTNYSKEDRKSWIGSLERFLKRLDPNSPVYKLVLTALTKNPNANIKSLSGVNAFDLLSDTERDNDILITRLKRRDQNSKLAAEIMLCRSNFSEIHYAEMEVFLRETKKHSDRAAEPILKHFYIVDRKLSLDTLTHLQSFSGLTYLGTMPMIAEVDGGKDWLKALARRALDSDQKNKLALAGHAAYHARDVALKTEILELAKKIEYPHRDFSRARNLELLFDSDPVGAYQKARQRYGQECE